MLIKLFQIFIAGFGILIIALFVNIVANFLGLETWYSFLANIRKNGFWDTVKDIWPHLLFLVFIYPFLLGLAGYYLFKVLN
jgi:hypothetical protein